MKNHQIKANLWLFVNSLIENPSFDSQTKDTLTTKESNFGSVCVLPPSFLNSVVDSGIIDTIVSIAEAKDRAKLKKLGGNKKKRVLGIDKLDDANWAGTAKSEECVLILTEGDSAKSLADAGIETLSRDKYGSFPLKGKMLNV